MSVVPVFLIFSFIGILVARQPDVDINRVKLIPKEKSRVIYPSHYPHIRRSVEESRFYRSNDYDDHSGGFTELRAPVHILHSTKPLTETKTGKVHQPREDPRFFYQSDTYLQENNRKNINPEVSSIYPGRDVVRAGDVEHQSLPMRMRYKIVNSNSEDNICVRCPHDRTLIARPGADRVMLLYPHLLTCSGRKAPRDARFVHMYGPKFSFLLGEGPHVVVGQIEYRNKVLQTCRMQIHVLLQTCPIPKYLVSECRDQNKTCTFTCRDPKFELHGQSTLSCGNDMKWIGNLPVCRAHTWCESPPPPDHGRVSCKGATSEKGSGLAEGSTCRVRCARGWRSSTRAAAVCRRGAWTHELTCYPKRNTYY